MFVIIENFRSANTSDSSYIQYGLYYAVNDGEATKYIEWYRK